MPAKRLAVLAAAVLLLAPACSHKSKGSGTAGVKQPSAKLADAKAVIDKAATVHVTLATSGKVGDLRGAEGSLKRPDAFTGKVNIKVFGSAVDVPVISTGGKLYAKLPLTPKYATIDPAKYNLTDPAALLDPNTGLSTLLIATTDPTSDGQIRVDGEVTDTITGTLEAAKVAAILPVDAAQAPLQIVYNLAEVNSELRRVQITDADGGVYTVTVDQYDAPVTIPEPN